MKSEEYYRLIRHFEKESKSSPKRYTLKVLAIAFGGYLVIWLVFLSLSFGLLYVVHRLETTGAAWPLFVALGLLLGLWIPVINCLVFRPSRPEGLEMNPDQFPWLYEQLEKLRKPMKTGSRKIRLVLNWDFNASAMKLARFGFFGPTRYYLTIGIPILAMCNTYQLRALIAHELAHFSGRQTRLSGMIWRVRQIWMQFLSALQNKPYASWIFIRFTKWYSPYFEAGAVVLSRQFEFEADKMAGEAVGVEGCAELLLRLNARHKLVTDYWEEVWRKPFGQSSKKEPEVEKQAISNLVSRLREPLDSTTVEKALKRDLESDTLFFDSHPCLSDRLENLGIKLPEHDSEIPEFADTYRVSEPLQSISTGLVFDQRKTQIFLDNIWQVFHTEQWILRIVEGESIREALGRIEKENEARRDMIGVEKKWKKAWLEAELGGLEAAVPVANEIIEDVPDHPGANFFIGNKLLEDYDALGIIHLETAIQSDPLAFRENGLQLLADYYRRMGSSAEAEAALLRSFQAGDEGESAVKERNKPVRLFNRFSPHQLSEDQLDDFRFTFAAAPEVKRVYAVQKAVKYVPDTPYHVLIIELTWKGTVKSEATIESILKTFAYSTSLRIVVVNFGNWLLFQRLKWVPNSLIFKKDSSDRFKYSLE